MRFDLKEWEPEGFLRLDGQAICVVGSGSASGLEGKVMVPLGVVLCGWSWRFASARPGGKGEGDGEGSERRPVGELVVGERVVQLHGYIELGVVFNGVLTAPPRKTSESTDHWDSPIN